MQFNDIIGQNAIKNKLIQTVLENRISHAQLFLGPEGSGSLALALAYAQFINCEYRSLNDSCGQCASCRKYSKIIHPDLHFSFPFFAKKKDETTLDYLPNWREAFLANPYITLDYWRQHADAENRQANINIAECHQIIKKLSFKPFEAEYKVLIMWLPEYLAKEGNALLKLIEEPPQKTLFLLVAENQDVILTTIRSRTQLVKINRLRDDDIKQYLIHHHQLDESQAKQIAYICGGNLQKAHQLLGEDNNNHFETLRNWLLNCYKDDGLTLIERTENDFSKMGRENQKSFLLYSINILREVLLIKEGLLAMVHLGGAEKVFAEKFAGLYSSAQIEAAIELFERSSYNIERNANPKILFLDVSLQLVLIFCYETLPKGTQYI